MDFDECMNVSNYHYIKTVSFTHQSLRILLTFIQSSVQSVTISLSPTHSAKINFYSFLELCSVSSTKVPGSFLCSPQTEGKSACSTLKEM